MWALTRLTRLLLCGWLLCGWLLCGCANRTDSMFAGLDPQQAADLSVRLSAVRNQQLRDDLKGAFSGGRPRNVLVLSGGDADGAFGCGLLRAWRDDLLHPRPPFDVVTGVSTGALMATFAFLGQRQDDETLHSVYTGIRDKDVYAGPFTPGEPDSVFDTGPLRRLITRHVTRDVFARVAAAHRQGRRLYVATVELDSGQVVIWPLSHLAAESLSTGSSASADAGLEKFRRILLAAASIPVLFPPVKIDGGLHVDAGLREALFLRRAMLGPAEAATDAATDAVTGAATGNAEIARDDPASPALSDPPTVYAIVNGKLHSEPEVVGDDLIHVGVRSLNLYTDALQLFNLRDVAHVAIGNDPPFRFRYVAVPENIDDAPAPGLFYSMFDPEVMARLYAAGEKRAKRTPSPWQEGPPRLDEDPDE